MQKLNLNGINSKINLSETTKAKETKKNEIARPQLKEHCSSKAGQALRGLALGAILAASVISVGKATTVPVKANELQNTDNHTSITQEAEENVEKTDIEMAVEKAINSESKTSALYVKAGEKVDCKGEMTGGDRFYEKASISEDGVLTFYEEEAETNFSSKLKITPNGEVSIKPKVEREYNYTEKNSFNLGISLNNKSLNIKIGAKFEEMSAKNGDYVQLAEDGKTFIVYNEMGNQIGSCSYETIAEHNANAKSNGMTIAATFLTAGIGVAGIEMGQKHISKKEDK